MGLTEGIAKFAAQITYQNLPDDVIEEGKRFLYETVAACLLGSGSRLGQIIVEVLLKGEESGEGMLIGIGKKRSLRTAAFYNTVVSAIHDSAGGYMKGIVHPGKNVVPAALTVASANGTSGKDLILATILGIECYARIDAVMTPSHVSRGHYDDGTVGTIGSTIAVGKLFGLDKNRFQSAIGNAAMLTPCTIGGTNMFRSDGLSLAMGQASAVAILAVKMAQAGIEGPRDILECSGGFCQALSGVTNLNKVTENMGRIWESRMFYNKPFVGCRLTHALRQGAQILKEKHDIKVDDIEKVILGVPAEPNLRVMSHHANIGDGVGNHVSSGPYLVANVLMYDDVGPDCLNEERMGDKKVHELASRIKVIADPDLTKKMELAGHELKAGNIKIVLKNGHEYSYSTDYVKGDPLDGWRMTTAELQDKLRQYARGILSSEKTEDVINTISKLEEIDDTGKLMNLLAEG